MSKGVEESEADSKDEGPVEWISYWKPNITINLVDDFTRLIKHSSSGTHMFSALHLSMFSLSGLKHDAGLAVEWSLEEQHKLEEGLSKFADEPSIMRYIKIAATLRDKTVRDVALRCRWMAGKLSKSDDASWKEREAAVLALGAIAEGCINGLMLNIWANQYQFVRLKEFFSGERTQIFMIVAFLIPLLDDKFPLIRSISCWTLSRFSKFIVQGIGHPEGHEQFDKVLTGLLRRILDNNKRCNS